MVHFKFYISSTHEYVSSRSQTPTTRTVSVGRVEFSFPNFISVSLFSAILLAMISPDPELGSSVQIDLMYTSKRKTV